MDAADAAGTAALNAGYHDQREALRWVKNNIASFGGDPSKVSIDKLPKDYVVPLSWVLTVYIPLTGRSLRSEHRCKWRCSTDASQWRQIGRAHV